MSDERRNLKRSKFAYYMQVFDDQNQQVLGYLADISAKGFQLDIPKEIPVNQEYVLRLDLTAEISEKPFITFTARCRWSRPDSSDPFSHNAGFQVVSIAHHDDIIFQRIVEKYGSPKTLW